MGGVQLQLLLPSLLQLQLQLQLQLPLLLLQSS